MKACKKMFFTVMVVVLAIAVQSKTVFGDPRSIITGDQFDVRSFHYMALDQIPLSSPRKSFRSNRDNSSLTCGQNALCGTLDGNFDWVYGQVGIYYFNTDLNRNVFVPLYVKEAALSGGSYTTPYMIPKWDGKVFWMTLNPNKPPLWIQPYYLDDDPGCSGCMKFISRAMLYKQKDKDYSDYPYGAALMYMYVSVDADFTVKSYTIDVYDQDDNLPESGKGLKLNIGDQVQTIYVEDDDDDDSPDWNTVSLEDPVLITQEPKFEYAGYIPGRDIGCSNCGGKVDLPQTDLFFRIVGYHVVDGVTERTRPTYSARTAMGKLSDNVCAAYPQLTTKEPTLADVIEGLKILASLIPQNFCFRDVNTDGKFDMAEVVWMLQKIVELSNQAMIYNGVAADADSAKSLETVAKKAGYQTEFFSDPKLIIEKLKTASLMIFGGTEDDLSPLMNLFNAEAIQAVKDFINNGGVYLGVCGGAFIASEGWDEDTGFVKALGFAPIKTDSYLATPEPVIIKVKWKQGEIFSERAIYYQFGPKFLASPENPVQIIAQYDDDSVAACLIDSGKGKLILVGPHPEADASWIEAEVENSDNWTPTDDLSDALMSIAKGK